MNHTFKIVSAALLAGVLSTAAIAGPHGYHDGQEFSGKHHERMMKKIIKKLDLSEEQQASIAALKEQHKVEGAPLRERMRANRQAMKESSRYDNYDPEVIATLAAEQGKLSEQKAIIRAAHRHEFQSLLTAEQREKMQAMKDKRSERRKDRKERKKDK